MGILGECGLGCMSSLHSLKKDFGFGTNKVVIVSLQRCKMLLEHSWSWSIISSEQAVGSSSACTP